MMRAPVTSAVFVFAFLALFSTSVRTQDSVKSDDQFLYNEALRASLEAMNSEWGKLDLTESDTRAPIKFHDMIVYKDPSITDGLNSQFGEYRVTYLDNASLMGRWRRLRKEFAILGIQPVDCPDGRLRITINLCWVSIRHTQLQLGLDSWADVYFRYDTTNRKYVLDNVELAGV